MTRGLVTAGLAALCVGVAACAFTAATPDTPALAPSATVQDLMKDWVDPSADALWAAVGTVVTQSGTEERQPRTDEEWATARRQALMLTEAAQLLQQHGRRVAPPSTLLEDAHVAGILTATEIQAAVDRDQAHFRRLATALQAAGTEAVAATEARDAPRLMNAGERIEHACESCHTQFWYPNDNRPAAGPFRP